MESIYNYVSIIGHEVDSTAIKVDEVSQDNSSMHCTTKGCNICIAWKDRTFSWNPVGEVR
jgi:hypothetical protein